MFSAQDQVVIYNETFRYVYDKLGYDALKDLWAKMSKEWCYHLDKLTAQKGLEGAWEYWCKGEDGMLEKEEADYTVTLKDNVYTLTMHRCPSMGGEIIDRGYEIFPKYCEHCPSLYAPVLKKNGLASKWYAEFDLQTMLPTSKCSVVITPE